jgi:hypothetical protein
MNKNVETGGAKDVKKVTSIDYPITYEKTREVVNYLGSKPIISNPATMYKDLISQKQFKDIPYEVVRTIVAIYYEDKGKVVAKKLHSEIKQMFSAIPLNKYGANVKSKKMAMSNIKANIDDKNGLIYLNGAKHEFLIGGDGDVIYDWVNSKNKNDENGRMLVNELITIAGAREKTNQNERAKSIRKLAKFIKENLKPKMMAGGKTENKITLKDVKYIYGIIENNSYNKGNGLFIDEDDVEGQVYDYYEDSIKYSDYKKILKAFKDKKSAKQIFDEISNGKKMMAGGKTETEVTVKEFNSYFQKNYGYISHSLSNKQIEKYLNQPTIKRVSLPKKADYFQDYLLANGLTDDVQMMAGGKTEYAKGGGVGSFVYTIGGL